ncbi:hypothetical protein UAMX_004391 [Candidatus Uabimicrobium amorphum]
MIEVVGVSVAEVTEDLKITRLEHYYDNSQFLGSLTKSGKCPMS